MDLTPYLQAMRLRESDLIIGSRGSCEPAEQWPPSRRLVAAWVLTAAAWTLYAVGATTWTVTSVYRCPQENEPRGGEPRSRHLYGAGPGLPFGAIDIALPSSSMARLRSVALQIPGYIRRATGWPYGVGLIVYENSIHLDLRERPDFVQIQ